jgi:hypothetical protein
VRQVHTMVVAIPEANASLRSPKFIVTPTKQ